MYIIPTSFITNLNKQSSIMVSCCDDEAMCKELPAKAYMFVDANAYKNNKDKVDKLVENLDLKVQIIEPRKMRRTLVQVADTCKWLASLGIRREDSIIAMGGKTILDILGFAAAIYYGGVDFYMIPTTLLAMTDTAIGGVYHLNATNYVKEDLNIQAHPLRILICSNISKQTSLPVFCSGLANIMKLACVDNQATLFKMSKMLHFNFDKREIDDEKLADIIIDAINSKIRMFLHPEYSRFGYNFGDKLAFVYSTFVDPTATYGIVSTIGMELTCDIMLNHFNQETSLDKYQRYHLNVLLRAINPQLDQMIDTNRSKLIDGVNSLGKDTFRLTFFNKLGRAPIELEVPKNIIIEAIQQHQPYKF